MFTFYFRDEISKQVKKKEKEQRRMLREKRMLWKRERMPPASGTDPCKSTRAAALRSTPAGLLGLP